MLPCGPRPWRPWQELSARRLHDLLDELSGRYDHILLDSAALSESGESRAVWGSCDGVLVVVRIGKTDTRAAEAACDGLLSLGARILGVVINAVPAVGGRDVSFFEVTGAGAESHSRPPNGTKVRGGIVNEEMRGSGQRMQRPEH